MSAYTDLIENQLRGLDMILLTYLRDQEKPPSAIQVKRELNLLVNPYPVANEHQGDTGWLYGILMRRLEDQGSVVQYKVGSRAFVRVVKRLKIKGARS